MKPCKCSYELRENADHVSKILRGAGVLFKPFTGSYRIK
jgi:hypothetical protein